MISEDGWLQVLVPWYLCHQTCIWEPQEKAGAESQLNARGDEASIRGFPACSIHGEIDEHKNVGGHTEDEPQDDDRMPPALHSEVAKEPKEKSSDNLPSSNNDPTQSCKSLSILSKPGYD